MQGEPFPVHGFELSTCIRAGLLLKSQPILWLTTMGKLQAFWETLNSSQLFILVRWKTGKMWLQNEKEFREGLCLLQVMFCLHFYVSGTKKTRSIRYFEVKFANGWHFPYFPLWTTGNENGEDKGMRYWVWGKAYSKMLSYFLRNRKIVKKLLYIDLD